MENKKKILLIDDEKDFCFFVKGNLENTGEFDVLATTSGKEGIKLARGEKPDLILLDLNMPEMSGDEVAQILSDRPETKAIPVVFFTALVTKDELGNEVTGNLGGYKYIAKPIATKELMAVIRKILKCKNSKDKPPIDKDIFDRSKALKVVEGDMDFFKELANLFLSEVPENLSKIRDAMERSDARALEQIAHHLKGSIGNFGAGRAHEAAYRLELLGREETLSEADEALSVLEKALEELETAMQNALTEMKK